MDESIPDALDIDAELHVRDAARREIEMRVVPWDVTVDLGGTLERFVPGAFDHINPGDVVLWPPQHAFQLGGSASGPVPVRVPAGRGIATENRADGQVLVVKVAATSAGDDILALANEGLVRGVSAEFRELPGGTVIDKVNGRRRRNIHKADLRGVVTTYSPAYGPQAEVLSIRSTEGNVSEIVVAPEPVPDPALDVIASAIARVENQQRSLTDSFTERFSALEERSRMEFVVPAVTDKPAPTRGSWLQTWLAAAMGERIPQEQLRALDDVITSDNLGVVPPAYLTTLIGVIDASRPFLSTTRRLTTPEAGLELKVPKINQRPLVGVQATEKTEVESRKTLIGVETFDAVTIAGAGDLSLQILRRSSPSFLELWSDLLFEAYAIEAEDQALTALANAMGGWGGATALDPENLVLGPAYQNAFDAMKRPPDTIWLSTEAVAAFIDAKASTTNQPMYGSITADATAAGGIRGTISGLRAVHVPTLDAHGAFAIVGPSNGFAWAEDGTYTLQADNVPLAGRDVGIVSIMWFIPWYPDAFTLYNVAS